MRVALSRFRIAGEIAVTRTFRVPGQALAYEILDGSGPTLVFCPGYGSDMAGTKAMRLWAACAARGEAMLRFDYGGHGQSGGKFIDGCIGDWAADAAHVIATACPGGDIVLVGSSMGGWISLLLAPTLGPRLRGLILIAPAPDFTERLIKPALSPAQAEMLVANGVIYQPSDHGDPTPITLKLIEDGARHLVLDAPIAVTCPVRIMHGLRDQDVPWELSLRLTESLESEDVRIVLVKDGEHRLSREADLELLEDLIGQVK